MAKKEQLDLFPSLEANFELLEADIHKHKQRMTREVQNKSGAIQRIVRARYDDILSQKIAEENLELRKEIKKLQSLISQYDRSA